MYLRHFLINIDKYIEFTTHVGLLCCFILYHKTKTQPLELALDVWKPFFIYIFSILLPICMTQILGKPNTYSQTMGGDAFRGSSKLPTDQQLVETCTKSDHLEMGSWLMLKLSSPLQQPFWVKNSSKHMHSRPGHFSSVFHAPHQNGRVMEPSNSGSCRISDGMNAVVWTPLSRQIGLSFQQGFMHLKYEMPQNSELACPGKVVLQIQKNHSYGMAI